MMLLVMALLLVFTALSGYVLNVANRAHDRTQLQEAVDRAAYTSAATTARGLNFVSHANIAILQITAELAVIDAIGPTCDDASWRLDIAQGVANMLKGSWFGAIAGIILDFLIQLERIVIAILRAVGQALRTVATPALTAARQALALAQKYVVTALWLVPETQGVKAGHDVLPGADIFDSKLRPWEIRPRPASLPVPSALRVVELTHYRSRAFAELTPLMEPTASKLDWLKISQAGGTFRRYCRRFLEQRLRNDGVQLWALQLEGNSVDQGFADTYFRKTWGAHAEPPRALLASIYRGEQSSGRTAAVAESMAFNPASWDLVTPRWEAALVPVKRRYMDLARPLDLVHAIQH